MGPVRATLPDRRLHFQHGPIDLIIGADGRPEALAQAVEAAWMRFQDVLPELVGELRQLRRPMSDSPQVTGPVARRMVAAAGCFPGVFLTPMAAVAGAVADEMIQYFRVDGIERAYVNNGGDIALHLTPAASYRAGLADVPMRCTGDLVDLAKTLEVHAADPSRGIATSGWRGRSFSLGIADTVTVTAATAALADAAATLIANAVNIDSPAVVRRPADALKDDTDLGACLVTVAVGRLTRMEIERALDAGQQAACHWQQEGLIDQAVLTLAGDVRAVVPHPQTSARYDAVPRAPARGGSSLSHNAREAWCRGTAAPVPHSKDSAS